MRIRFPARGQLAGKNALNLPAAGFNVKKERGIVADFARMDSLPVDLLVENDGKAPQEIDLDIDVTEFEPHGCPAGLAG